MHHSCRSVCSCILFIHSFISFIWVLVWAVDGPRAAGKDQHSAAQSRGSLPDPSSGCLPEARSSSSSHRIVPKSYLYTYTKLCLSFEYRQACLTGRGNSGSSTSELVAVDLLENVVSYPTPQKDQSTACSLENLSCPADQCHFILFPFR